MVIVVKYLTFITRADNQGAGGILALLALVPAKAEGAGRGLLLMLALFGTALLYGDGVITPAISVLSAMEGLKVATVALKPLVLPLTAVVLIALFLVQRRGTGGIGKVFGPVTLVWFFTIAALGVRQIVKNPHVLLAIDPRHGASFFIENGGRGFLVLGSVFLVVTGGEALYADMGHFGRRQTFLEDVERTSPHRVKGTAVFMASSSAGTPPVLLHHFKHNQALHEQVVLLTVETARVPEVPPEERLLVVPRGSGFYQVTARYGFMQTPDVPRALRSCAGHGLKVDPGRTSYYLGRETILPTGRSTMWRWRKALFAFVSRNARPATNYFNLPPNRVVELGMQINL
jgi:K+ transporter